MTLVPFQQGRHNAGWFERPAASENAISRLKD